MTEFPGEQHAARATLTYLAEPGDPVLAALLRVCEPAEVVAAVRAGEVPAAFTAHSAASEMGRAGCARLGQAIGLWRSRLAGIPSGADPAAFHRDGIRLTCPGDPEWPTQLDTLGSARPYALWLRGSADLRYCCLRSASIVGARAATAYGAHVSTEMSAALAERGWTIVSGGAYGIDGCAHRGALAADGVTVAVLACGVDYAYPRGHESLLASVAAQGVVVSEWPPGTTPMRRRFLVRNRVIAALTRGTAVVEAGLRSGALSTAAHARDLGRPLMAVPGPVTSGLSAGCHKIIREWGASCVTCAQDVIELLAPLGESMPAQHAAAQHDRGSGRDDAPGRDGAAGHDSAPGRDGVPGHAGAPENDGAPGQSSPPGREGMPGGRGAPVLPHDRLDPVTAAVLDAVPAFGGAGPARIAVTAGVGLDAVMRSLGLLAAGGFIERCNRGWRTRRHQ